MSAQVIEFPPPEPEPEYGGECLFCGCPDFEKYKDEYYCLDCGEKVESIT